jgi:HEAT repeat protein
MKTTPVPADVQQTIDAAVAHGRPLAERKQAINKLGELGNVAAVVPLATLLDGAEGSEALAPDVRAALGKLDWQSVVTQKLAGAKEDKLLGLELIGAVADPSMIDAALATLADPEAKVRERGAATLGRLRTPRAMPALVRGLDDAAADVRMASAQALGVLGSTTARSALESALKKEQDAFVKVSIESALAGAKK